MQKRYATFVPAVLVTGVGSVHAALPAGVEAAITGAGADAATAMGLIIVVMVAIWALRLVKRIFG